MDMRPQESGCIFILDRIFLGRLGGAGKFCPDEMKDSPDCTRLLFRQLTTRFKEFPQTLQFVRGHISTYSWRVHWIAASGRGLPNKPLFRRFRQFAG
jgi:hypothetical protein